MRNGRGAVVGASFSTAAIRSPISTNHVRLRVAGRIVLRDRGRVVAIVREMINLTMIERDSPIDLMNIKEKPTRV